MEIESSWMLTWVRQKLGESVLMGVTEVSWEMGEVWRWSFWVERQSGEGSN